MIEDVLTRLWIARGELDDHVHSLRECGHAEAARELSQAAHRLGNQLLEADAVVQQYAEALAASEKPVNA